ncbi:MAG: bifunctional folylpolyglutamate synthase/dihydrofolate synthase [Chloroflexi bacterium]|nr:bifunctional folylpolyglutamate synthase/dihydrofolate synthase [Chloroflexota bacterium]
MKPQSLEKLYNLIDYEKWSTLPYNVVKLERAKELLSRIGNPQEGLKIVLIAGTKGKGSCAAMISSIICNAGYKVGTFTNPHVSDFRERIRINLEPLPGKDLDRLIEETWPAVESMEGTELRKPTYFEVCVALAYKYFHEQKVDLAVMEVGMGGRLDATNCCSPTLSVIMPVSIDHTDVLGETVPEIASEKAGILHKGAGAIISVQQPEADRVISEIAASLNIEPVKAGRDFTWQVHEMELTGSRFSMTGLKGEYNDLYVSLPGKQQVENAAAAVGACEMLSEAGFVLSEDAIRKGLACLRWPARMEFFPGELPVLLDVSHNHASAKALREFIEDVMKPERAALLFACLRDKDIEAILRELLPIFDTLVISAVSNPRCALPEEIESIARRVMGPGYPIRIIPGPLQALKIAGELGGEDLLVITGSFYLAGEIRPLLSERSNR